MTAPPISGRSWGTAKVLAQLYWESKIPASLAPGNYLIRHELLHRFPRLTKQRFI